MEQKTEINPSSDRGVFVVTTENETRYVIVERNRRWAAKRFPSDEAPDMWLDEGSVVNGLEVSLGQPIRCIRSGGYLGDDMWLRGGATRFITQVASPPGDLSDDELQFALDSGAFAPVTVERGKVPPSSGPSTSITKVADAVHVDGTTFTRARPTNPSS